MMQSNRPTRVIYAKLTTTGAYDVVARTAGVPLEQARALAEQLLPGNPPLDATPDEIVGYLHAPDGAHTVMRFARYPWKDGDRGDVYSTDIVQLSGEQFRIARCNAFALVQRSDRVFDVLTELDDVHVPATSAADEHARLRELAHLRDEARAALASILAAECVLLVHGGQPAPLLELITLLLPPSLRSRLTFLTRTYRVPPVLPRVTIVDRASANLRDGAWTVLPSADVDVPMELAGRLVELCARTDVLALAHELHDQAAAGAAPTLRAGINRLLRAAALADALSARDVAAVLDVAAADPALAGAALHRLRSVAAPGDVAAGLLTTLRNDARAFEQMLAVTPLETAELRALVPALPAAPPATVVTALTRSAAAQGASDLVVELLARDRRAVIAQVEQDGGNLPPALTQLFGDLRRAGAPAWDIGAALALHDDAQALAGVDAGVATQLADVVGNAVDDAVRHVQAQPRSVPPLRALLDRGAHLSHSDYPDGALAALAAAHVDRALDAHAAGNVEAASAAMREAAGFATRARQTARELILRHLDQRASSIHALSSLPGADALVDVLGGSAAHARVGARIVEAIRAAATREDGIAELAGAVYAAHAQQLRITAGSDLSRQVTDALRAFGDAHERSTPAAELCLELLSVLTPADHMTELEDAALGTAMTVRLRRLDRSIAICRAAEDERRYDRIARALETDGASIDAGARERLRDALGTGGISRRLMKLVSSVVDKGAS